MLILPAQLVTADSRSEAKALYTLGSMYLSEGRLDAAIEKFAVAASLWPESVIIRHRLATACLVKARVSDQAKDKAAVTELAWRALKEIEDRMGPQYREEGLYEVCMGLGDLCAELHWWTQAEECFEWAWKIGQEGLEPLLKKGAIEASREAWDKSEETFRRILEKDSENKDALYHVAHALWRKERLRKAVRVLDRLVQGEEPDTRGLFLYGLILESRGRPKTAQQMYERLLQREKDHKPCLRRLASLAQRSENWEDAVVYFRQLVSMDQGDAGARFGLAAALERTGLFRESALEMKTLMVQKKHGPEVLNYLGYMFAEKGIYLDQAEELILEALRYDPKNGAFVDSLGWVYYQKRQYRPALEMLLQAKELLWAQGEDDPVIREHIGDTYAHLGRQRQAMKGWKKALRLDAGNRRLQMKLKTRGLYPPF